MLVLAVLFLIPCGFGAWAANLADKRGRSPGAHFALGFFLGPLGVLITALRAPDHVALANRPEVIRPVAQPAPQRGLRRP